MKQSNASRKLNEQAREVLANILLFDVADPRLRDVTITGCEVSFDRSYCNVFYTTSRDNYEGAAAALDKAMGRIRSLMGRQLTWRVTPELRFHLDTSVDEAMHIAQMIFADAPRNAESAAIAAQREAEGYESPYKTDPADEE